MSKKLFPLISILLIAVFALSACTKAAPVTGKVVIWQAWKENEITSLNEVIDAFKAANPEVTVEVLYVPFDDLRNKFETEAGTGGGPTILIGSADWGPALFNAMLIDDLSADLDQKFLDTINPAALAAVEYKDAIIGLPQTLKGVVLFRNKAIIADAATDFADLLAKAQAATTADVTGAFLEYGFFFSAGHLSGVGGALMDANGDPAFNNEKGVEWLNLLNSFNTDAMATNYTDDDVNLFKEGKVGWIIDGTWNASALAEAIGAENLVVDEWPSPLSGYVQTENIYLNANAVDPDRAAGIAFLKFFLGAEAQALLADPTKAGHIPAISGVELTDPIMNQEVAAFAKGAAFPVIPEMGAYWDPGNNATKKVILEGMDPAAALQEMFDAITAALPGIRGQ